MYEEVGCIWACSEQHFQINLVDRKFILYDLETNFVHRSCWAYRLDYMRTALEKRFWNRNNWLYDPSWLCYLDYHLKALLLNVVHLFHQYLWVRGRFLVVAFIRWFCNYLFPLLYLVDLVLKLNLFCVQSKHLVSRHLLLTLYLHRKLLYVFAYSVPGHLSVPVDSNQLLWAILRLHFLSPVVVVKHLLYGVRARSLGMNEISCSVLSYLDQSILKTYY